jgi:DNA replication protein DnaC
MAQEITAEEAQANLEAKRKALGINPSTPSTSKKPSGNIEQALSLIVPKECWRHKLAEPCPECDREHQEERAAEDRWQREYAEGFERAKKAALLERANNPEKILRRIGVGPRHLSCSFDTYKGGDNVKKVCDAFIENPFDLVLSGGPGTGKTHLAIAIFRYLVSVGHIDSGYRDWFEYHGDHYQVADHKALFMPVPELLAEIRATYNDRDKDEQELIDRVSSVDFLILDDLGAEKSTEWSISTLYLIIDKRYRAMNPTIATTNLSIDEIGQSLSRRIASRLASGKVITIKAPDYRMKRGTV